MRRFDLSASAIVEIVKTYDLNYRSGLARIEIDDLDSFLKGVGLARTFVISIQNLRIDNIKNSWSSYYNWYSSVLENTGTLLLFLLRFFIPLTAAYGGIHLSAWDFEFPSRVESIIWRTACFIIIGSSFAVLAEPSWRALDWYTFDIYSPVLGHVPGGHGKHLRVKKFLRVLNNTLAYSSADLLLSCYAAARLYIVIESFVSLRHVPIGVYAAVPWVENIPHV